MATFAIGRTPSGLGLDGASVATLGPLSRRETVMRCRQGWRSRRHAGKLTSIGSLAGSPGAKTRTYKEWVPGERSWYWRSKPRENAGPVMRSRIQGAFHGLATVLFQQRRIDVSDGEGPRFRHRGVVWVVDGTQLVRCHPAHLRPMQGVEKVFEVVHQPPAEVLTRAVRDLPAHSYWRGPAGEDFRPLVEPRRAPERPPGGEPSSSSRAGGVPEVMKDAPEEPARVRRRISSKRPPQPEPQETPEESPAEAGPAEGGAESSSDRQRRAERVPAGDEADDGLMEEETPARSRSRP